MGRHLIIISVDALVYEDLLHREELPNIGRLLEEGALIKHVKTIYPALTHPVHATVLTGCATGKTGIVNNTFFEAGKEPRPWFNSLQDIRVRTILHAAHEQGLSVCACRWPVTAHGEDVIDYLVPEVMGLDMLGHEDDPASVYRMLGTQECLMDIIEEALRRYGWKNEHPLYDAFETFCACEIIRRYQPELMFIHSGYVDGERHRTGLFTDYVRQAVCQSDAWIGEILNAVKDAGIEDSTDVVIMSDHGQLAITRVICPNVFLRDQGLIRTDEKGSLLTWDAYVAGAGLSGQVYLSKPEDPELNARVYKLLTEMAEEGIYGISEVLTKEEMRKRYGLYGDFSFAIETDGFTSFSEAPVRPAVRPLDTSDYRYGHATHGHMPEKGPQPPFIGAGPSFRKGVVVEEGNILNHAPTFARILGLELPDAEGKAVEEILS